MKTKVLIVKHDNKSAIDLKRKLEQKSSIEVCGCVNDGVQAITNIKRLRPDIVILDLFSGSGNLGIEALSQGAKYAYYVDEILKSQKQMDLNMHYYVKNNQLLNELYLFFQNFY